MNHRLLCHALLLGGVASGTMAAAAEPQLALTVYSSARPGGIPAEWYRPLPGTGTPAASALPGFALVRMDRDLELPRGRSRQQFSDVAALIDPTTVQFRSLTDPAGTRVLEQDFQFDLVGMQKLLSRYVDQAILVERADGERTTELRGTLLSAHDGLVLRGADGQVHALNQWSGLRFGELPGGLITRPTLAWEVQAAKAGTHRSRVTYQTGGITWWADYNLVFSEGADANSGFVDLGAWVSLLNQSGTGYDNARLKLVAGDVNRIQPEMPLPMRRKTLEVVTMAAADGFTEQAFFEYHLYTLGRPATLPNNSTKQIELFEATPRVPARKRLVYAGAAGYGQGGEPLLERDYAPAANTRVEVWLSFRNDRASGLGLPLPAGRVRVAQLDRADGSLEFIGEDALEHTPKDEDVRVRLGTAFDVVGERRQTDFQLNTRGRVMEEAFEIRVRNHKEQAVAVVVREELYRCPRWQVIERSQPFAQQDARRIEFPLQVPADGEAVVTYRVRYTW